MISNRRIARGHLSAIARHWIWKRSCRDTVCLLGLAVLGLASPSPCLSSQEVIRGAFIRSQPEPPPYPPDWRVRGFEGFVDFNVEIDTTGSVVAATPVAHGYADTDSSAMRSLLHSKFELMEGTGRGTSTVHTRARVAFAHPRSSNLVLRELGRTRATARVPDAAGQEVPISVLVECSASLDSVTGAVQYRYTITNDPQSQASLLYLALYPIELGTCEAITRTWASHEWSGFQGCSGHIDVAGWMARENDPKLDPRSRALKPGESVTDLVFESFDAPGAGHWIAGGGRGCDSECFPWGARCSISDPLTGAACVPLTGGLGFRSTVSGEVADSTLGYVAGAKVEVLGTRQSTIPEANGHYVLRGVPTGRFRVRASAPGYVTAEKWAEIQPGDTYLGTFTMSREEPTNE